MGVTRSIGRQLAPRVVPRVTQLAPGLSASFVREALHRALDGAGPFTGAAALADKLLRGTDGDVDAAVKDVVDHHIRYAGVQGFATNLGGLVTMTVAVPANITGLAVLQDRMVAGVAHLRGYDLDEAHQVHAVRLLGSTFHGFVSLELAGGFAHSRPPSQESWTAILASLDLILTSWSDA